ncbi:MAG: cytoplasmic protein [Candidatus Omnitrophica bacterium]|nr:cytoplasmic protein [Candidatus Omnitrophota bacterium]
MTTLAKNAVRDYELGDNNDLPVIAGDIIYEGAAVGENGSGYFRPLAAGDPFAGFAVRKADNSAVGAAAGDVNVNVLQKGKIELNVVGVTAVTDEGSTVYASDDNVFTLSSTSNSAIGKIVRYISGTKCIVAFEAASVRSI